jgi:uncharacterized protein with GYD domain
MKTFILLTKLSGKSALLTEIGAKLSDRPRSNRAWLDDIKKQCPEIQFKTHLALMGYWDSMHIYEAPDEECAARVSIVTRAHGATQVETWLAIPYEKIARMAEEIEIPKTGDEK